MAEIRFGRFLPVKRKDNTVDDVNPVKFPL